MQINHQCSVLFCIFIDMEMRFPGGMKVVQYRKAKLEKFAPHHQIDGLVTRLTIYKDLDCKTFVTYKTYLVMLVMYI